MAMTLRFDDLRVRNREAIIASVRRNGNVSRTSLAAQNRLSHSTISSISADLIEEGALLEERAADLGGKRRGRPQVNLSLRPELGHIVTCVLLLNKLTVSRFDYDGTLRATKNTRLQTTRMGREALVETMIEAIASLAPQADEAPSPLLRIAMAVQGVIDADASILQWSPITPHGNIPFGAILEQRFRVPVTVDNDCSMIAAAMQWRDPFRYSENFIAVLLSHGIGMGLVLHGSLFTGTRSSGVEFGHMTHMPKGALCRCGRLGCIEAYAGNYAIWRNANQFAPDSAPEDVDDLEMSELSARARQADGPERAAYQMAASALGYGLGSLFALIDPAPVLFIGSGAASFDLMEETLRATLLETAGGAAAGAISFETYSDEIPLIREGCAIRALKVIDREIVAKGESASKAEPLQQASADLSL